MFSQACVIPSVHRDGGLHPGVSASRGSASGGGVCRPPLQILQDTVNERVVRILLECILVCGVLAHDVMKGRSVNV